MLTDRMTLVQAAAYIGVSDKTLYIWYENDRGPRAFKLGGRIYYLRADIDAWANAEMAATARGGVNV